MIRPIGGELWQWDTGRTVEVRAKPGCTVDEVHFYNGTTESALLDLVDIVDNVVTSDIPNIFLQSANNLVVYSVMVDEKGNRTTESATFAVHKREKPDDYVYTETEIQSWDRLNKRIATIESEPPCGVTYIHSPDADKNYTFLRDLESGTYILDGTFIAYSIPEGSTKFVSFSYGFPVVIGRTQEKTHLQCLYPPYNTLQYAEITDDSFIRSDKKMQYVPDITMSGTPGQIMEVYKVDDRNIPVEWKLVDLPAGNHVPDAAGETVTSDEFNALLVSLRSAGLLKSE